MNNLIGDEEVQIQKGSNYVEVQELDNFINSGYFAKRCTDKFSSGTFTDRVIKQELMRSIILTLPYTHGICKEIERFYAIHFTTSDLYLEQQILRSMKTEKI